MEAPVTALIVDDEPAARCALGRMLASFAYVRVIGAAGNVTEAAELASAHDPELILLDIGMPMRDGFELLPMLTGRARVVFVTAFDEYAVRAFELHAIDYLIKPVRRERMELMLQRFLSECRGEDAIMPLSLPAGREEVVLRTNRGVQVVPISAIAFIKGEANYTCVQLADQTRFLVRRSMLEWAEVLPADRFIRAHRSMIIGLRYLRSIEPHSRDEAELTITGCRQTVTVGRKASLILRRRLGHPDAATEVPA